MKKLLLQLLLVLLSAISFAQAPPQGINYQAVARNNAGAAIISTSLTARFSIHDLTASGTTVYQETHAVTTNVYGLFTAKIGMGIPVSGTFSTVNWGSGDKYLEVEVNDGSGFVSMGASQMMSVPYALYSQFSANGPTGATGPASTVVGPTGPIGATGDTGPTGPASTAVGPTGVNGPTGATGDTGPTGPASTVVGPTGATGATGAGLTGATGATGPTGIDGATGVAGATGATGATGVGAVGPTGTDGAAGTAGPTGVTGPTGSIGTTGPAGDQYATTSVTSMTIIAGSVTFTVVDLGLAYSIGQTVIIANSAANQMIGTITAFNPGTGVMTVNVTSILGAGTFTSWSINLNGAPGPAGSAGPTGPTGLAGSVGATGGVGPAGPTGAAGTTGATGTAGAVGATGATGLTGATGTAGTAGAVGATGTTGANGATGLTGATGTAGTAGATGANGATGLTGATGTAGTAGTAGAVGATGATGLTGATGTAGTAGATGANGATGLTGATGTAGTAGATGANGATGLTGATGTAGTAGATGATGATGLTGATGTAGTAGAVGATGATGLTGATGTAGTAGAVGATGLTGETGTAGTAGAVGATGATGFLTTGAAAGNTPYWNGTSWVVNSSNIFNNGSNVGIGTTTPAERLQISNIAGSVALSLMSSTTGTSRLYFGNPTNTFFGAVEYNSTNNSMNFWTNNTPNRMVIDNSGNIIVPALGIAGGGTVLATAAGALYTLAGSPLISNGTANYFPKWNAAGTGLTATSLLVDNGTTIGIGISTPTGPGKLHVYQNTSAAGQMAYFEHQTSANTAGLNTAIYAISSASGTANNYGIYTQANASSDGTTVVGVEALATNTSVSGGARGLEGVANVSGTGLAIGLFGNASGSTSSNWAGYFNQGNVYVQNRVAIGSTLFTPTGVLHVKGANWSTNSVIIEGDNSSAGAAIRFNAGSRIFDIIGSTGTGATMGAGYFGIYDATGGAYRFTISPTGNVGIGMNTPGTTLEVNGAVTHTATTRSYTTAGVLNIGDEGYIRITSSGAATIAGALGAGVAIGQTCILENSNAVFTFTMQVGGNLRLNGNVNFIMGPGDTLTLIWNGTQWLEIGRSNN